MPSEHIRNLRLSWVFFGWFTAVALASLALLVLDRTGLLAGAPGGFLWGASVMLAFLAGGAFTGYGVDAAPDLHGVAIALFSVVAWVVAALLASVFAPGTAGFASPLQPLVILAIQAASAVLGARMGVRFRRR